MAIGLSFLPIGAFLGEDESIPSLALAAVFASGGNRNSFLDQYGRARTIFGYTQTTAVGIVSQRGTAMRGRGMYMYGQRNGNAVTHQLLCVFEDDQGSWEVHVSYDYGRTFQFLLDAGTRAGAIPDFAQLGTTLILTNDALVSQPLQWDGNTLTAIANVQLAAPTFTDAGVGQLMGKYRWKIVPVKADGTRKLGSLPSALTVLTNRKATIGWNADADAASYEVYRTTGTGVVYYFEGAVKAPTVTFTTNQHDLEIIGNQTLISHGDTPVAGFAHCEAHAGRMWYGTSPTALRSWFYSDPGLPTSLYAENVIDFTDEESATDISVGAVGNFKRLFVAFLERSVWVVSGSGTFNGPVIDYVRRRTDATTGAVSIRAVCRVPAGARYRNAKGESQVTNDVALAYLTPQLDIRLFDGNDDEIISFPKAVTLKRLTYAQRRKAHVVTDKTRGEFTWVFPADGNDECSLGVTWNYHFGTWDERDIWPINHSVETDSPDAASVILGVNATKTEGAVVAPGAVVLKLWDGTSAGGAAFTSRLMTSTLYGVADNIDQPTLQGQPMFSVTKRWRWAELLSFIFPQTTLLVESLPGEADDDADPFGSVEVTNPTEAIVSADGQPIQSADGQPVMAEITDMRPRRIMLNVGRSSDFSDGSNNPRYLHSRGIRLRFTCVSSTGGFMAIGANIAYQVLRGLKRTFRQ